MNRRSFCGLLLAGLLLVAGCGPAENEIKPVSEEEAKKAEKEIMEQQMEAMQQYQKARQKGPR